MFFKRLFFSITLACITIAAHADNLVSNGGFETGDFSGWTVTQAASGSYVLVFGGAHTGYYSAHFDGLTAGSYDTISQTLPTTPGITYLLQFYIAEEDGDATNRDFQALWNGNVIFDSLGLGSEDFTLQSYTLTGIGNDVLAFRGFNVPYREMLDDVSVSALSTATAPEPSSIALLGTGLLGLAGALKRRLIS